MHVPLSWIVAPQPLATKLVGNSTVVVPALAAPAKVSDEASARANARERKRRVAQS